MATKSANLYTRIEPDVKEQAEGILAALGIPASNAINMFYKQIILQRGLTFEVKMPSARPVGISALSEAQMNAELEKGYADMQSGHTRSAKSVFYAHFYGRRYRPWLTELWVLLSRLAKIPPNYRLASCIIQSVGKIKNYISSTFHKRCVECY